MRDSDWKILEVLYEKRSITQTAELLYMTQPSVTKRIKAMEEEWQIEIVKRSNRGVIFTEEGRYLVQKSYIIQDFMKEIISQGLPVKKQETPLVTVETPDKPETVNKEEIKAEPKEEKAVKEPARRKKNTPGDYRETYFMRVDLTDRQPLYVSRTTHEKLMKIVTVIGGRKATVSSYVENILLRHFDQFQDEINELYESKFEKPF